MTGQSHNIQQSDKLIVIFRSLLAGCLFVIKKRLDTQVTVILMIFSGVGALLAMVSMLCVVLACCLSTSFSEALDEEEINSQYTMRSGRGTETELKLMFRGRRGSMRDGEDAAYYTSCESKCL